MNYVTHSTHCPKYALIILNFIHGAELQEAHEATQRRIQFLNNVKEKAEQGLLALVTSGRDCDGVQYWNNVRLVEATVAAVEMETDSIFSWADGPCEVRLASPSEAALLVSGSRDLGMEAFEDGHPHVLYA